MYTLCLYSVLFILCSGPDPDDAMDLGMGMRKRSRDVSMLRPPTTCCNITYARSQGAGMGKVRSRRSKGKGRLQPTGLPSVKEAERQSALEGEGPAGAPLLDKVRTLSTRLTPYIVPGLFCPPPLSPAAHQCQCW